MKKIYRIILATLLTASLVVEFLVHHQVHFHFWFSDIPLFWILFGFLGGCLLILFGKKILAWVVYREEDYYE
jgi:hypothetical protein